MKTEIGKWGNSLAVRIPRGVAADTGLSDRTIVELSVKGGSVILRPLAEAESPPSLDALVQAITPQNLHSETEWGDPRGRELW